MIFTPGGADANLLHQTGTRSASIIGSWPLWLDWSFAGPESHLVQSVQGGQYSSCCHALHQAQKQQRQQQTCACSIKPCVKRATFRRHVKLMLDCGNQGRFGALDLPISSLHHPALFSQLDGQGNRKFAVVVFFDSVAIQLPVLCWVLMCTDGASCILHSCNLRQLHEQHHTKCFWLYRTRYASCVPSASTFLMVVVIRTHFLFDGCMSMMTVYGAHDDICAACPAHSDTPAPWFLDPLSRLQCQFQRRRKRKKKWLGPPCFQC